MSIPLLALLMLPPLAALVAVSTGQRGPLVGRLLVQGYALATFDAAVGDLSLASLRGYAAASPGGALFVSLSAGLLFGGALPWPPRGWRTWSLHLPVAVAALVAAWSTLRVGPWLLGGVLGATPLLLGSALPSGLRPEGEPSAVRAELVYGWWMAAIAVVTVSTTTLIVVPLAVLLPLLLGGIMPSRLPGGRRQLVLPLVGTIAALVLVWLALTIAGDVMAEIGSYFTTAPVSPAAERWLGLLAVVVALAMLAPWPLDRFGLGLALAPAAAILAYRLSQSVAPAAIGDWQPVVGLLLVPVVVVSGLLGRWPQALATMAVLAAMRPGLLPMVASGSAMLAAVALAATSGRRNLLAPGRVTFAGTWWHAVLAAVGAASAVASVLRHEVVLATLLAAGLACAAARVRGEPAPHAAPPT